MTLTPKCGFTAQLTRTLHRYRRSYGFESRLKPESVLFHASPSHLLKLVKYHVNDEEVESDRYTHNK